MRRCLVIVSLAPRWHTLDAVIAVNFLSTGYCHLPSSGLVVIQAFLPSRMPIGRRGSFTGSSKDVQGSGQGSNAVLSGTTGALTGNSDWTMGCHPFSHEVYLPMGIHLANTKMDQYLHSLG